MKPLIGIGLISYNRAVACTHVARSIIENLSPELFDYHLVCTLDQENTEGYEEVARKFNLLAHRNYGISINKSIALRELKSCDHVFIIEDDLLITKKGWETLFLNVHQESGIGLFNYHVKGVRKERQINKYPSGGVIYDMMHSALMMSITKDTLDCVGAFDPRYVGYGGEHFDYTRRCFLAKKIPNSLSHFIVETYNYTEQLNIPGSSTPEERKVQLEYNSLLYAKGSPRTFIPFEEVNEVIRKKQLIRNEDITICSTTRYRGETKYTVLLWKNLGVKVSIAEVGEIPEVFPAQENRKLIDHYTFVKYPDSQQFANCWWKNCAAVKAETPFILELDTDIVIKNIGNLIAAIEDYDIVYPMKLLKQTASIKDGVNWNSTEIINNYEGIVFWSKEAWGKVGGWPEFYSGRSDHWKVMVKRWGDLKLKVNRNIDPGNFIHVPHMPIRECKNTIERTRIFGQDHCEKHPQNWKIGNPDRYIEYAKSV